MQFKQMI